MRNFFKRKEMKPEFTFTTRSLAHSTMNGELIRREGASSGGEPQWSNTFQTIESIVATDYAVLNSGDGPVKKTAPPVDPRRAVEPKDVFKEIKTEPLAVSFDDLPRKIAAVEQRIEVLKEHLDPQHLGDENRALFYLRNRLKYLSTRKKHPLDWAMSTNEAIDDLCRTYKLKVVPLKQFYTLVPEQGVKEMDRYSKAYKAITGDAPIFNLVIKDDPKAEPKKDDPKPAQAKKDRDPILFANSPLGNHVFVLGAWDDEVEIVDEIIYQGK